MSKKIAVNFCQVEAAVSLLILHFFMAFVFVSVQQRKLSAFLLARAALINEFGEKINQIHVLVGKSKKLLRPHKNARGKILWKFNFHVFV